MRGLTRTRKKGTSGDVWVVMFSRDAVRQVNRLPEYVASKLQGWAEAVELFGLPEVRKYRGFHDEGLEGSWFGHRSIRLSRSWRVIYRVEADASTRVVVVVRVSKHD